MLDIEKIKQQIALRYPYLLVDRVIKLDEQSITTVKNVTINEPFFQGHFPEPLKSIMPGTLVVESMAQSSALLALNQLDSVSGGYLAGVDSARFRRQVIPGDQLIIKTQLVNKRKSFVKTSSRALVEREMAAEAELLIALENG